MLVDILKRWEKVLIQLFTSGLLFRALRSKSLSSEVYYSKVAPRKDMATLAFTKVAPLKVIRL